MLYNIMYNIFCFPYSVHCLLWPKENEIQNCTLNNVFFKLFFFNKKIDKKTFTYSIEHMVLLKNVQFPQLLLAVVLMQTLPL